VGEVSRPACGDGKGHALSRRRAALRGRAAILLACAPAPAQEEAAQSEAQGELKSQSTDLRFTIVDLVYKSDKLVGAGDDVGGKGASLKGQVEDLAIKETKTEVRIELSGDILFDFDKATLRPAATPVLERVAEVIRKYGKPMVRIEGHTDSKGSHDYNVKLSQRRADSVKDWLVKNGAIGGALVTKGFAETQPVAPNQNPDGSDNPEGRQKNRRVEIIVKKM
jgi:outer membrane protein OmpA-like peptidoglycan-associated protein